MIYFKALEGSAIDALKNRFQVKKFVPEGESYEEGGRGQTALLPGEQAVRNAAAIAEVKKNWPKCGSNFKYLYTFKDGSTVCTLGWRNEFYVAQTLGQMPDPRLFDAAERENLGKRSDVVLDRTTAPGAPVWSKPWFIPAAAVGVGIVAVLLITRSR